MHSPAPDFGCPRCREMRWAGHFHVAARTVFAGVMIAETCLMIWLHDFSSDMDVEEVIVMVLTLQNRVMALLGVAAGLRGAAWFLSRRARGPGLTRAQLSGAYRSNLALPQCALHLPR